MDLKGIGPDNMPLDVFNGGADAVSQLDLGHVHRPLRASARADGVGVESLRRVSDISVYSEVTSAEIRMSSSLTGVPSRSVTS